MSRVYILIVLVQYNRPIIIHYENNIIHETLAAKLDLWG